MQKVNGPKIYGKYFFSDFCFDFGMKHGQVLLTLGKNFPDLNHHNLYFTNTKLKTKNTVKVCVAVKTNIFHHLTLLLQSTYSASVISAVRVIGCLGQLRLVGVGAQYIC